MIGEQLITPSGIVVVGASDNLSKPGGKVLRNLVENGYKGEIYAINPKVGKCYDQVQWYSDVKDLKHADLAILAIPARECYGVAECLLKKGTRAFIVFSAGFSETGEEGEQIEKQLAALMDSYDATLIGPNCIGVIQEAYKGVFTSPIPDYYPDGCELISGSGATAVFILEAASQTGLRFSNVYSIGNGLQTGVESILEYMDLNYVEGRSPKIKLLYLEQIRNPFKFIKHVTSLIEKGCHIAAIKSGHSEAGSRAASSHTGALATSDTVIRALFRKCGIVYCSGREELISVAGVFQTKKLTGNRLAIVTHAGGSAVMLTDALTGNNLTVPHIGKEKAASLLKLLNPGSSVENPIDFLATGTAPQLGEIIDFCEKSGDFDGIIVVFGSSGLINVRQVYDVLLEKMKHCTKPIYAVLPSIVNAAEEIRFYLKKGRINFPDEVVLGQALSQVAATPRPVRDNGRLPEIDFVQLRTLVNSIPEGMLNAEQSREILQVLGIETAKQYVVTTPDELRSAVMNLTFPVVMKVQGPVHKTEVNGVRLNILSIEVAENVLSELMQISGAKSVLIQEMLSGEELYCGAVRQGDFGHLVLCGLGGIFLELLKDTAGALAPVSKAEAQHMVRSLKGFPLIAGYRNRPPLNEEKFIDLITRIAALVHIVPEIVEIDLNPIIATGDKMIPVDVRIKLLRNEK